MITDVKNRELNYPLAGYAFELVATPVGELDARSGDLTHAYRPRFPCSSTYPVAE
jgi:hypothetical protein